MPAWLNEEVYAPKIQPLLAKIANPAIISALGVSVTYAVAIRAGRRRPHPRHWAALAELVGISADDAAISSQSSIRLVDQVRPRPTRGDDGFVADTAADIEFG
ncbi:MAG: hypothetical protein DMG76_15260 [Acidobacteria bacterium]|nr:MAG: hypothetical protein DMG76_15260 [Acidobacteriota bacterium]